jgi:general secretion pathway protein D
MKTNLLVRHFPLLLLAVVLTPPAAHAQFDQFGGGGFGGGMDFPKPAWEQFKLNPKTRLKLDFRNASIDAVLSVFSKASGITIVKDPSLTGGITLQSPTDQTLKDAFAQLNAILGLKNFDLTKSGNFLVIKGRPQSSRGGSTGRGSGFPTNFDPSMFSGRSSSSSSLAPKVYALKYASATQVARVINDVFAGSGQQATNPLAALGSLLGGGAPGSTAPATPPAAPGGGGNGPSADPGPDPDPQRGGFGGFGGTQGGRGGFGGFGQGASSFGSMFGGGGFGRGGNTSVVRASADDYSNSVIVNAPTREQDQVADLIEQIDKQTDQPQKSQVFPLQFALAADLATVVQNVLVANAPRGRGGATAQPTIDQRFGGGGFGGFGRGGTQLGQGGFVVTEARTNSLVVTSTQDNLDLVVKVIKELDKPITFENSTFVITLENARADQMADILNQSFGSRTGARTTGRTTGLTGATNRTNNTNNRAGGGNAPASLGGRSQDLPGEGPLSVGLADPMAAAGELATNVTVQQGFGGFGGFGGGGFGGSGFGGGTTRSSQQAQGTRGLDANGRVTNLRDLTGQVTIIPDINTNSVIIVTSPQNRELLQQIVDQLDKIPEQVMIETVIVEASLDANSKLGVEWNFTQNKILGETGARGAASSAFGGQASTTQPQGLRYTLTGGQYGAFLQSLQTDARFEVLSTPRIFTSNNATAEINISQSLPYVTSTQTNGQGVQIFNYAFLDVGIILTVTPRITSNGFVTMDVTQTANDFVRYTDFNAPVVNQREAQTTVSVKDGETIVLGGIIKNSVSATTNKLPILGDLPVLGKLFQSNTTTKSKTELLVFLTPRIVRDPEEARKLRDNTAKQMQSKLKDKLPQFGGIEDKEKLKPADKTKPGEKPKEGEKKIGG